jgi:ATP-binding cassette subfamily D (ALD) protein 4
MRGSTSSNEAMLTSDVEYQSPNAKTTYSFDGTFLKRFSRLLRVLFHAPNSLYRLGSTSKEARKGSLFWLYVGFVGLGLGYEVLVYYVGLIPSRFYGILTSRDIAGFSKFVFPCLLLVFATATVKYI